MAASADDDLASALEEGPAPQGDRPLPGTGRVIAARGLRSFTQGFLNVVTPLYLLAHGVSSTGLGVLYSASFLVGAVLTAPIGVLADRFGRKRFLVAFTVLMAAWGALYATTAAIPALLVASAVAGIGRGGGGIGGGQAGPFAPAEQALIADLVPRPARRRVFSVNAMVSSLAAAAGSGIAGLPEWLGTTRVAFLGSDRALFVLTIVLSLVSLALLWPVRDPPRSPVQGGERRRVLGRRSARLVVLQSLAGGVNALGTGFVNALFVVWAHLRYHAGASEIGPLLTASYLASAASIWLATGVAGRIGSVRTIVATRLVAVGFTVGMALSPAFLIAAGFQVLRSVAATMATPVRQAFTMGLFASDERGAAAGFTAVARRLSGAASPPIAGAMLDSGAFELPIYLAAGLQLASAVFYRRFFSELDDRSP